MFAAVLTKPVMQSQLFDVLVSLLTDGATAEVIAPVDTKALGERHPLRILLAEDNTVNQKIALLVLESMGYRADVASNGASDLADICGRLEAKARVGDATNAPVLAAAIAAAFGGTREVLVQVVAP